MKKYIIHGEILSPVHIGTGDELEPFDYVIKDGKFIKFDMIKVLSHLSGSDREAFDQLNDGGSLIELRNFIADVVNPGKDAEYTCVVTESVENFYREKLTDIRNQMLIRPFIRTNGIPYIPGSSIKGAVRTAIVSDLANSERTSNFLKKKQNDNRKYFDKDFETLTLNFRDAKQDPFRTIKFSDIHLKEDDMVVGDVVNVPNQQRLGEKDYDTSIPLQAEYTFGTIIGKPVEFTGELSIDDILPGMTFEEKDRNGKLWKRSAVSQKIGIDQIIDSCYKFYDERFGEEDSFIRKDEVWEVLDKIVSTMEENESIIRLGRFSGAPSVTADNFRSIPARKIRGNMVPWRSPGSSRFYVEGDYPMGWVKLRFEET